MLGTLYTGPLPTASHSGCELFIDCTPVMLTWMVHTTADDDR